MGEVLSDLYLKDGIEIGEIVELGYHYPRYIEGVGWCGIRQFIFTVGVCYGLDRIGYTGRFCFKTLNDELGFYDAWNGIEQPVVGQDGCTAIK